MPVKKNKIEKTNKETQELKENIKPKVVKQNDERIPKEILDNPNSSPIFDIFLYRELFMSLRQKMDSLYDKKDKSEKDYGIYDDAVYSITNNAFTESAAQDFLSYCFKKGKYDFCLMNYEKYMKWEILAAANGNAFAISKLQIFLTNAIEDILTLDNHNYLLDFLDLTVENYFIFLGKMICEEIVKILNITPEGLIKMPETYQEQNEDNLRLFDNTKIEATKNVKEKLKSLITQLINYVKEEEEREREYNRKQRESFAKSTEEIKQENSAENLEPEVKEIPKKTKIKRFRY